MEDFNDLIFIFKFTNKIEKLTVLYGGGGRAGFSFLGLGKSVREMIWSRGVFKFTPLAKELMRFETSPSNLKPPRLFNPDRKKSMMTPF